MRVQEPRTTLYDLRCNFGLSLETVAGHLSSTEGHVEAIEAGIVAPIEDEIIALSALYSVSAATLTGAAEATKMARKGRRKLRNRRLEIIENGASA